MRESEKNVWTQFPYLPLTDPVKQLDAVMKLWAVWAGPIHIKYAGRQMMLLPMNYYLEYFCHTPGEVKKIQEEIEEENI